MYPCWRYLVIGVLVFVSGRSVALAAPDVVTSIKPVHSLASALMQGIGEPRLIVDGAASPHGFSLKPSQARALQGADIIFWVGEAFEAFLERPIRTLGAQAETVALIDAPGVRAGGFPPDQEDGRASGGVNPHVWLDPENARAMARAMAETLAAADPPNARRYVANGRSLSRRLDELTRKMTATLAPVKDRPFVVFHDAFQHLERRFGLNTKGALSVNPEVPPGAERVRRLRATIRESGVVCVFAEPQFNPKLVRVLIEGTPARSGTLDPIGAAIENGPSLYFELMRGNAASLRRCLER